VAGRGEAAAIVHRLGLDKQRPRLGIGCTSAPGSVTSGRQSRLSPP
jgi:hypothetical protein